MNLTTALLALAGTAYVIARQVIGEPVQLRRLVLLPLLLTVWATNTLDHGGLAALGPADGLLFVAGSVAAAALGLARGMSVHLFMREGVLWYRSTVSTLVLWAVSVATRALLLVTAHVLGATVTMGSGALLLTLGLTLGAQSLAVYMRGTRSGIPFSANPRPSRHGGTERSTS
ncbi:MAG: hypothetical protein ACYDGR_05465 [Candidatus Dormibacteria bacterium]